MTGCCPVNRGRRCRRQLIADDDYYSLGIDFLPTDVGMTNEQSMGSIIMPMDNRVDVTTPRCELVFPSISDRRSLFIESVIDQRSALRTLLLRRDDIAFSVTVTCFCLSVTKLFLFDTIVLFLNSLVLSSCLGSVRSTTSPLFAEVLFVYHFISSSVSPRCDRIQMGRMNNKQ